MSSETERHDDVATFALTHLARAVERRLPGIVDEWAQSMVSTRPPKEIRQFVEPPSEEVLTGAMNIAHAVRVDCLAAGRKGKKRRG